MGDKPLPCDPLSVMRRPPVIPVDTRLSIMGDRYLELMEADEGLRRTHVPFVALRGGELMAAGCADTPGMYYMIPALAATTGLRLSNAIDLFFAMIICLGAMAGIGGFFVLFNLRVSSYAAVLSILLLTCLALRIGDVYLVMAAASMAVIPWTLVVVQRVKTPTILCMFGIAVGVVIGLANVVRDQAATPLMFFVIIVLLMLPRLPLPVRIWSSALVVLGLATPILAANQALRYRDAYLHSVDHSYSPPSHHHVFWHTAYLGLGFIQNEVVPGYRDEVAIEAVRKVAPDVVYASAAYDAYLRPLVLDVVLHHRRLVAINVIAKVCVVFLWLLLFANVGLVLSILYPKPVALELAFWVAMLCASVPGLIAVPTRSYLLGFCCIAGLYGIVSINTALEAVDWRYTRTGFKKWICEVMVLTDGRDRASQVRRIE